jgi:hypothetical protein
MLDGDFATGKLGEEVCVLEADLACEGVGVFAHGLEGNDRADICEDGGAQLRRQLLAELMGEHEGKLPFAGLAAIEFIECIAWQNLGFCLCASRRCAP